MKMQKMQLMEYLKMIFVIYDKVSYKRIIAYIQKKKIYTQSEDVAMESS